MSDEAIRLLLGSHHLADAALRQEMRRKDHDSNCERLRGPLCRRSGSKEIASVAVRAVVFTGFRVQLRLGISIINMKRQYQEWQLTRHLVFVPLPHPVVEFFERL